MMEQYFLIKEQHPDAILFFRLGDFYEMFFEDAKEASKILEIALTGRSCGLEEKAPMCGIPFHSCDSYIQKLIQAGKKVAICEQMEDPKKTKGLVKFMKRDVPVRFLAKKSMFGVPVFGKIIEGMGLIPVDRETNPSQALLPATRALKSGEVVCSLDRKSVV